MAVAVRTRSLLALRRHATLAALSLAVAGLAFVRDAVAGALFGATRSLDSFFLAYYVIRMVNDPLQGALTTGLLPWFSSLRVRGGESRAWTELFRASKRLRSASVRLILAVSCLLLLGGYLCRSADALVEPAFLFLLGAMVWMIPSHVVHATLRVGLDGTGRFSVNYLSRLVFSAIAVALAFALHRTLGIAAMAVAFVLGSLAQVVVLAIPCRTAPRDAHEPSIAAGSVPRPNQDVIVIFLAASVSMISGVLDRAFATVFVAGTLTAFHYSRLLVDVWVVVVPSTVSQVLVAKNAASIAEDRPDRALRSLFAYLGAGFLGAAILGVLLWIAAVPLTSILFGRGAFLPDDVERTADFVQVFAIFLPILGLHTITAAAMKAARLNRALLYSYGAGVGLKALALPVLIGKFDVIGLVYANVLAEGIWLLIMLAVILVAHPRRAGAAS